MSKLKGLIIVDSVCLFMCIWIIDYTQNLTRKKENVESNTRKKKKNKKKKGIRTTRKYN